MVLRVFLCAMRLVIANDNVNLKLTILLNLKLEFAFTLTTHLHLKISLFLSLNNLPPDQDFMFDRSAAFAILSRD